MQNVAAALEASQSSLRGVARELEAEFERLYCSSRGTESASVNPMRLAARLAALESVVPSAADAVLKIAHANLESARTVRKAVLETKEEVVKLTSALEHASDLTATTGERNVHEGLDQLDETCNRLSVLVVDSQRAHSAYVTKVSSQQMLSNDDLDLELLKAGVSADGMSKDLALSGDADANKPAAEPAPQKRTRKPAQKKRNAPPTTAPHKENDGTASNSKACPTETGVTMDKHSKNGDTAGGACPISKGSYQRLPRNLKQIAKLDELNELYHKVYDTLTGQPGPLPTADLIRACGETSIDRIDVLRRGFSLLKQSHAGWTLSAAGLGAKPQSGAASAKPAAPSKTLAWE